MENIKALAEKTLTLFPNVIDISDGELRDDNGFYSKNLSDAWHKAEAKNVITGNDVDFMIWAIFGLLHRKSRENYLKGIHKVTLKEISIESIEEEYKNVIKESNL